MIFRLALAAAALGFALLPADALAVKLQCVDGSKLRVIYPDPDSAMVAAGGKTYALTAERAASGAKYGGGGVTLWEHHGAFLFSRGGRETRCMAAE
jgi:membrane-bound inhibitor of C-type lysozyme